MSPRPDLGYVFGPEGRRLAGSGGPLLDPPAPADEPLPIVEREPPIEEHTPPHPQEEEPMTTTALATPDDPGALAHVPRNLENMFTAEDWALMSPEDRQQAVEFFREEQRTTTEGLSITFPKIKYPTSGSSFWEIPSVEGETEAVKSFDGVVVFKQMVRGYWRPGPVSSTPPVCSSVDLIRPTEDSEEKQAATCAICRHSKFGSGLDERGQPTRGQACKQRLQTFLLLDSDGALDDIPTVISLPPTALSLFSSYAVLLHKAKLALVAVATTFGLTDAKNKSGTAYKQLTLKIGRRLTYPEMVRARKISDMFKAQMEKRGLMVDDDAHDPADDGRTIEGQVSKYDDGRPLADQLRGDRVPF
jgi:hypothetical protein